MPGASIHSSRVMGNRSDLAYIYNYHVVGSRWRSTWRQPRGYKMAGLIIDRGRGPELEGTRVTVYCVMDYVRAGDPPSQIAEDLDLSMEQVQAALEYISAHRDEVEAQYEAILKRVSQPNPDWVEAGSAQTWDELRRRIAARSRGEPAHARHGR